MPHKIAKRILGFKKINPDNKHSAPLTLAQLRARYGPRMVGINMYHRFTEDNVGPFRRGEKDAWGPAKTGLVRDLINDGKAAGLKEVSIDLGLEPEETLKDTVNPYDYVHNNEDFARNLARSLHALQEEATQANMTLQIYLRFASEMNVPKSETIYGSQPSAFVSTYIWLRNIFRTDAPNIKFVFSPALRTGVNAAQVINLYWPAIANVDIAGGTWYVGRAEHEADSFMVLSNYVRKLKAKGKPFGFDEIGGIRLDSNSSDAVKKGLFDITKISGNDEELVRMMAHLDQVQADNGVEIEFATMFMEAKWGVDVTLNWLGNAPPP